MQGLRGLTLPPLSVIAPPMSLRSPRQAMEALEKERAARFVGADVGIHSGATSIRALPAGAVGGDLCVVFTELDATSAGSTITSSGGWRSNRRNWWYDASLHVKRLDRQDLKAKAVSLSGLQSGGLSGLFLYRDVADARVRTDFGDNTTDGPTLELTGFAKAPKCRGVLALLSDRDADVTIGAPSGFTTRGGAQSVSFTFLAADLLTPSRYPDRASVAFSGLQGAGNYYQHGYLLELL